MKKFRIIVSHDRFYPQYYRGFFSGWRFLQRDAHTSNIMLESWMVTDDPSEAAQFDNEENAREFVQQIIRKSETFWKKRRAKQQRIRRGVDIDNVITIE